MFLKFPKARGSKGESREIIPGRVKSILEKNSLFGTRWDYIRWKGEVGGKRKIRKLNPVGIPRLRKFPSGSRKPFPLFLVLQSLIQHPSPALQYLSHIDPTHHRIPAFQEMGSSHKAVEAANPSRKQWEFPLLDLLSHISCLE